MNKLLSVTRKIHRIGGSLAIFIPPAYIESKNLKPDDFIEIQIDDNLTIRPAKAKEKD